MGRKALISSLAVILVLVIVRFFGVDLPYHQDEYKAAMAVVSDTQAGGIKHPPLNEATYILGDAIFGNDDLRFVPLFFFIASLPLLYILVRREFGERAAWWSLMLFSSSFYSVLASLMVDVDGAVMPLAAILLFLSYFEWRRSSDPRRRMWWGIGFSVVAVVGLLLKFTFGLAIAAVAADFLISRWRALSLKEIGRYLALFAGILAFVALLVWAIRYIVPSFDIVYIFEDWGKRFFSGNPRQWLQVLIQTAKAAMYLSPVLVLAPLFGNRGSLIKTRLFWIFMAGGLVFYLALFDFSQATIDRYLQFLILPLSAIGGLALSQLPWKEFLSTRGAKLVLLGSVLAAAALFLINFLPHDVFGLHPKTEWLSRVAGFRWDFLFPFTGGSGPLGFYVSFLFIALSFIVSAIISALALLKKPWKTGLAIVFLAIAVAYNGVMAEEFIFGKLNGSSRVLYPALGYIEGNGSISSVVTYNDIGTYELSAMGKHKQRLYIAPQFEEGNRETLNLFKGHYLIVDIPRINPESFQGKYFESCDILFERSSGKISSRVYDCGGAPDVPEP